MENKMIFKQNKMENKKGSHVGLVLSFVIFVVFLIFMYPLVGPALKVKENKQYLLEPVEKRLFEQFEGNITTLTINIEVDVAPGTDCIRLQNDIFGQFRDILGEDFDEESLLVKDETGLVYAYAKSGQAMIIDLTLEDNPSLFFKIQTSNELNSSPQTDIGGCEPITDPDSIIGLVKTEDWIFESEILKMFDFYEEGYELLKEDLLKMPAGDDFGYSFKYSNGTTITTAEVDIYTSVYVSEISILYLNLEGNINSGIITIKVW